jgi:hypothetical protein
VVAYLDDRLVCKSCVKDGDSVSFVVGLFEEPPGKVEDRKWFADHPGSDWRVRKIHKGELQELINSAVAMSISQGEPGYPDFDPECDHIISLQLNPGERMRTPVRLDGLSDEARDDEISRVLATGRCMAPRILAATKALPTGDLELVAYAGTLAPMDALMNHSSGFKSLRDRGAEMKASRHITKH